MIVFLAYTYSACYLTHSPACFLAFYSLSCGPFSAPPLDPGFRSLIPSPSLLSLLSYSDFLSHARSPYLPPSLPLPLSLPRALFLFLSVSACLCLSLTVSLCLPEPFPDSFLSPAQAGLSRQIAGRSSTASSLPPRRLPTQSRAMHHPQVVLIPDRGRVRRRDRGCRRRQQGGECTCAGRIGLIACMVSLSAFRGERKAFCAAEWPVQDTGKRDFKT